MTTSCKLGGFFCPGELKLPAPKDHPVFLDWGDNLPDMTAIAVVHTQDGFVVGADGTRQTIGGPQIDGQKLFEFEKSDVHLGYAWCGRTVIWDYVSPDSIFFDFSSSTAAILEEIYSASYVDWAGFIHCFRELLKIRVDHSIKVRNWVAECEDQTIARMLLVGYVKDVGILVEVKVEQINSAPCVSAQPFYLPVSLFPFSHCKDVTTDGLEHPVEKTEEGRKIIHEYMKRSADNPKCGGLFGTGTILVAKITPDSFTWLDGPVKEA